MNNYLFSLQFQVNEEHKPQANPFLIKRRKHPIDVSVLATVQLIPNVGPVKAKQLLQTFGSIRGICGASEEVSKRRQN